MSKLYKFSQRKLAQSDNEIVKGIKDRNWFEVAGLYEDSTKIADEFSRHRIHFEGVSNRGSYQKVASKFFKEHPHLKKSLERYYSQGPVQFLQNCIDIPMMDKFNLMGASRTNNDVMNLVIRNGELYAEIVRSGIQLFTPPEGPIQYPVPGLMKAVFKMAKSNEYEGFQLQSIDTTNSLLNSILQGKTDQVDVKNPQVIADAHAEHEKVVKLKTLDGELSFSDVLTHVEFSDKRALPELFWEVLHSPIQNKDIVTLIKANNNADDTVSAVAMQKFNGLLTPNKYQTVELKPRSAATVFRKAILKNDDIVDALTGTEIANLVKDDSASAKQSLKTTFWAWMFRQDVGRKYEAKDLKTLLLSESRKEVAAEIFKPKTTFFGLIQYRNYSDQLSGNDLAEILLKDKACDDFILKQANLRNRLLTASEQYVKQLIEQRCDFVQKLNQDNKLFSRPNWSPYTESYFDALNKQKKEEFASARKAAAVAIVELEKIIPSVNIPEVITKQPEVITKQTADDLIKLLIKAPTKVARNEELVQALEKADSQLIEYLVSQRRALFEQLIVDLKLDLKTLRKGEFSEFLHVKDQYAAWARLLESSAKRDSQEDMSQKDGYVSDGSDNSENSEASDLDDPAMLADRMKLPDVCSVEKYENENMSLPPVTPEKRKITSVGRKDDIGEISPPVTLRYGTVTPN